MKKLTLTTSILTVLTITAERTAAQTQLLFQYPDTVVTWIVPAQVDSLELTLYGGKGGNFIASGTGYTYGTPGNGAVIKATMPVATGDTLYLYVGGSGAYGGIGGFNGGGNGASALGGYPGGGGGASDVRVGGKALSNRILVAAGGGGASYDVQNAADTKMGGNGGAPTGHAGYTAGVAGNPGGAGATVTGGGAGGYNIYDTSGTGTLGQGGASNITHHYASGGGGGGGGYYGGGGGIDAGGGGGSSFADITRVHDVQYILSQGSYGAVSIRYTLPPTGIVRAGGSTSNMAYVFSDGSGSGKLSITQNIYANAGIYIADINGKLVWHKELFLQRGSATIALPEEALPPGTYIIRIKGSGWEKSQTLKWLNR